MGGAGSTLTISSASWTMLSYYSSVRGLAFLSEISEKGALEDKAAARKGSAGYSSTVSLYFRLVVYFFNFST